MTTNEDEYLMEEPPVPAATHKPRPQTAAAEPAANGKAKKIREPSARDGKAKKGKDGEAAKFVPGAAAPAQFDPQEICELVDLWWELDGGDTFVLRTGDKDTGKWARWPKGAVKEYIRKKLQEQGRYIALAPRKGSDEVLSELDEVLLWARERAKWNN
ncbi:MAG: hypothetical protein LCH62_14630 [Proteobacteria bacterium]|nr:hypothetical protein [Pseudomonadota bacterium]